MAYNVKKNSFAKTLDDYEFMQQEIESSEGTIISDSIISVNCDTVSLKECEQIFFFLKSSLSVHLIILRGKSGHSVATDISNSELVKSYDGGPVFYTRYVIKKLCHSISDCLSNSERIRLMAFKNVSFGNDLNFICSGLRVNKSLKLLCFKNCDFGDEGCIKVCSALRKYFLEVLLFENCNLSNSSVSWIAWLIKEQSMSRTLLFWWPKKNQNDAYNYERGLRILSLNDNPLIRDKGAKLLIEALFEDKILKQVHMENTGITDYTCNLLVDLCGKNSGLEIFNTMRNDITAISSLALIIEKVSTTKKKRNIRKSQVKKNSALKIRPKQFQNNGISYHPESINTTRRDCLTDLSDSRSS